MHLFPFRWPQRGVEFGILEQKANLDFVADAILSGKACRQFGRKESSITLLHRRTV